MKPVGWFGLVVAFTLVAGCTRASPAATPQPVATVDEDQIATLGASSAYDVVARTHAEFLHSRGRESMDPKIPPVPAHVYVDDTYYSDDLNVLKVIPASQLAEVRFYQGYEAQYKFGSGHMGGVIQLITKR